jgi:transglutaminase/protease-like cytokinesis protein 3
MGYARILDEMCAEAGIPSRTISGYARSTRSEIGQVRMNHAWNAVKLNGQWYLCDPTWASGFVDIERKKFVRSFDAAYFLADPSIFAVHHYPADPSWLLLYPRPTLKKFASAPLAGDGFISNQINRYAPENGVITLKKGDSVSFRFTSNLQILRSDVLLEIRGKEVSHHNIELEKDREGFFIAAHQFNESGNFRVAIFINSRHSLEYSVRVR